MKIVSFLGSCGNWKNDEFCGKINANDFFSSFKLSQVSLEARGGGHSISFCNKRLIKIVVAKMETLFILGLLELSQGNFLFVSLTLTGTRVLIG